jgi:ATP synthase F1 delta subunit
MPVLTTGPEKRYATALLNEAVATKVAPAVALDMESLAVAINQVANLRTLLTHPLVPNSLKGAALSQLTINLNFQRLTKNFVQLVVQQGRVNLLAGIADQFAALWRAHQGEQVVTVTTAVRLNAVQLKAIETFAKQHLPSAKKITLTQQLDSTVLAGVKINLGSHEADLTVRGALTRLQQQLTQ